MTFALQNMVPLINAQQDMGYDFFSNCVTGLFSYFGRGEVDLIEQNKPRDLARGKTKVALYSFHRNNDHRACSEKEKKVVKKKKVQGECIKEVLNLNLMMA